VFVVGWGGGGGGVKKERDGMGVWYGVCVCVFEGGEFGLGKECIAGVFGVIKV
jgi:hypothetical protein